MTNNQVKVGIEQADSHCDEDCKVVVASIRSLREDRLQSLNEQFNFGLIIYDECHHAAAENMRFSDGVEHSMLTDRYTNWFLRQHLLEQMGLT